MAFDLGLLAFLIAISLFMGFASMALRGHKWAVFAFFGALVALYTMVSLGSAGAVAVGYQSNGTPITNDLTAVQFVPLIVMIMDFGIALLKGVRG